MLGVSPIGFTELSPVPSPSQTRPGASSATVFTAEATTLGIRVATFVTAEASVMRSVRAAASPIATHTSRQSSWESAIHAVSNPSRSARAISAATSPTEIAGGNRTPTRTEEVMTGNVV